MYIYALIHNKQGIYILIIRKIFNKIMEIVNEMLMFVNGLRIKNHKRTYIILYLNVRIFFGNKYGVLMIKPSLNIH